MIGRSGGPSPGKKAPASANMHQCRPSAARPFDEFPDISTRGRSMPSRELVKIYSSNVAAHRLSLGFFPVDRRDLMAPVSSKSGKCGANAARESADGKSQEPQEKPFACIAT